MSMPNIPPVNADIDIDRDKSIDLLIASVAFQELALAHLVNAEAEKIQFVLGVICSKGHFNQCLIKQGSHAICGTGERTRTKERRHDITTATAQLHPKLNNEELILCR